MAHRAAVLPLLFSTYRVRGAVVFPVFWFAFGVGFGLPVDAAVSCVLVFRLRQSFLGFVSLDVAAQYDSPARTL